MVSLLYSKLLNRPAFGQFYFRQQTSDTERKKTGENAALNHICTIIYNFLLCPEKLNALAFETASVP